MLRHHQLRRRYVLDLAPLDHLAAHPRQWALADATNGWTMHHLDIRDRDLDQRVPRMTGLAACLTASLDPLAARTAAQPITGGWFATVVAIFRQACAQVLHLRF